MTIVTGLTAGLLAASVLSACLYLYSKRYIGRSKRVSAESAAAPFLGVAWLGLALLIHVWVSNTLAQQDCGLSGDPYVTLPNGYVLGSLNTYSGYFKAPGFETDVPAAGPGYVRGLIDLKLVDGMFRGTQYDHVTGMVRRFTFDTRTRDFHIVADEDLSNTFRRNASAPGMDGFTAAQTSVREDAGSYWRLYDQYRHHWPNYLLAGIILVGETFIILWIRRLWSSPAID